MNDLADNHESDEALLEGQLETERDELEELDRLEEEPEADDV